MSTSSVTHLDPDLEIRTRAVIRFLNETLQYNANEPSLAFYRIQEHVQKTLPTMKQKYDELIDLHEKLDGIRFDVEYSTEAMTSLEKSSDSINNSVVQLEKGILAMKQIAVIRQQILQQQLFEKKDASFTSSKTS